MRARPSKKMSKRLAQYSKEQDEHIDALEAEIKELRDIIGHSKILCDIIEKELNRYFGIAHDAQIRLVLSNLKEILEQALNKEG